MKNDIRYFNKKEVEKNIKKAFKRDVKTKFNTILGYIKNGKCEVYDNYVSVREPFGIYDYREVITKKFLKLGYSKVEFFCDYIHIYF